MQDNVLSSNPLKKRAELHRPSQRQQASRSVSQWKRELSTIVLEMEKYSAGDLIDEAGDDDQGNAEAERD